MPEQESHSSCAFDTALYRDLVEMSQDLLWQCDAEGCITYLNPAWESLFGSPIPEMLGQKFSDFYAPQQRDSINGHNPIFLGKDGREIHLTFFAKAITDHNGKRIGERGTARDHTERIQAESNLREAEPQKQAQERAKSDVKYRTLFDSNRDAVMIQDESHFLDCNNAALEMFGCNSIEVFCTKHPGHLSPEYQPDGVPSFERANQMIQQAMEHGSAHFEWLSQRLDHGQCFPSEVMLSTMPLGGKTVLLATVRDITERRQAEEKLRLEQAFSEKILDSLPGIFYLYTYPELRLVRWNRNHEVQLGYSAGEIANRYIMDWHVAEAKPLVQQAVDLVMEKGQNVLESPLLHKNGSYVPFLMTGVRFEIAQQKYLMGIGIDITERKLAEDKLSTLFKSMTEMVALHDLVFNEQGQPIDYQITDCNQAFCKTMGVPRESAIGTLATILFGTNSAPFLQEYAQVATTGKNFEFQTYFEPLDKHFSISVVPTKTNSFATISTDITEIKRAQRSIYEKNKELENYLYVASHDMRSPMVNLQGFSQRLQGEIHELTALLNDNPQFAPLLRNDIPKTLHYILSSVGKMDSLINGLLQVSRTGRLPMVLGNVNMKKLIDLVIVAHQYQITEAGAQVRIGNLPDCYGDETLLNQLFSNILGNALKYRDPCRTLQIEIAGKEEYRRTHYTIQDTGIGIESRHMKRIWNVFFRVNSAAPNSGDGLGLSIIRRIAERHRGKVWAESQIGVGSIFHVELLRVPFTQQAEMEE